MDEGGRLMIETGNVVLGQDYADRHLDVEPGPYVLVAVSDTGHGMSPEVLARAIDPFFTTKGLNKGTGLGLSMVYGFIKQSGGHMKIYSEPGHGTVVKLYLPVADGDLEFEPARTPSGSGLRGTETILLVEDDAWVRAHAASVLCELGYTVLEAGNGPDALTLARQHPEIDLLFTDVIMPGGMNGPALAAEIGGLLPGVPVLFTSGYTENAIVHHGRVDPGVNLLHKPYRPHKLGEKVRQILDAAKGAAKE
jgi:CheY-like chemotaxis protein